MLEGVRNSIEDQGEVWRGKKGAKNLVKEGILS